MSALTRVLRELAEEGVDIAAATRRWAAERYGSVADTPENVQRVRAGIERAEPTVARPTARSLAVQRPAATGGGPLAVARRAQAMAQDAVTQTRRAQAMAQDAVTQTRRAAPAPLAARPAAAAEQPLALPPPAEPLPDWAAKPRGGQWWTNGEIDGLQLSPEYAASQQFPVGLRFDSSMHPLADWWDRAVPRYIRNDFGTADDPLRGLAEQGLLHSDMSVEDYSRRAREAIGVDQIGNITMPPWRGREGADPRVGDAGEVERRMAMPWLDRQPVTDPLYAAHEGGLRALEFGHVADELRNAMRPETSGIPADLAVRPESLQRMSFPQAVERVGRINQWRAAQQAEASLAAQSNPAVHTYREYTENNPRGLRWVELRAPEGEDALPEGWMRDGEGFYNDNTGDTQRNHPSLQDALRYEGDTMGHCVGGYCDDVMSGRSRIYSLRDSSGQPHVTVEAAPVDPHNEFVRMEEAGDPEATDAFINWNNSTGNESLTDFVRMNNPELFARVQAQQGPNIVQIKGKGNRAPVDEYLPFVQDFVRNGEWGSVGDLGNTGLVRLPDGRYITQAQYRDGLNASGRPAASAAMGDPARWNADDWDAIAPHFEGYALGGRVDPDRCFTRNPLAARR